MRYMVVNRVTEGIVADVGCRGTAYSTCRKLNGTYGRQYVVRSYFTNTLGV